MPSQSVYGVLADAVLVLHVGIAVFIVGGLFAIVVGNFLRWRWASNLWLRLLHLAAIGIVAAEAWLGVACPLTLLEKHFRSMAGAPVHAAGFVEYWLQRLLFLEAPPWVFVSAYSVFGMLVLATWWYFPPRHPPQEESGFVS